MPTFQIPQFLEEKPRVIGFLTLQQFFYLAAAGAISFIAFHIFNFFFWLLVTLVAGSIGLAFAFVRVNGQGLPQLVFSALSFMWRPRTYTWQRAMEETELNVSDIENLAEMRKSITLQERLKSIALNISTGKFWTSRSPKAKEKKDRYQVVTYLSGEKRLAKRVDY